MSPTLQEDVQAIITALVELQQAKQELSQAETDLLLAGAGITGNALVDIVMVSPRSPNLERVLDAALRWKHLWEQQQAAEEKMRNRIGRAEHQRMMDERSR